MIRAQLGFRLKMSLGKIKADLQAGMILLGEALLQGIRVNRARAFLVLPPLYVLLLLGGGFASFVRIPACNLQGAHAPRAWEAHLFHLVYDIRRYHFHVPLVITTTVALVALFTLFSASLVLLTVIIVDLRHGRVAHASNISLSVLLRRGPRR